MKVLISGAGIAGPTLAHWLVRRGIEPTLVEEAPALRTGGYILDFWGAGFDVAERMGVLPVLMREGYRPREVRMVDAAGRRIGGFSADVFNRFTRGRFVSIPRAELAKALYGTVRGRVETLFGDSISALEQTAEEVRVEFTRSPPRTFDVVIGADGLHSNVRRLAFGSQDRFERYLGYKVAAFEVSGYRARDPDVYVTFTQVGHQAARFSMRDDRTLFVFIFADPSDQTRYGVDEQKALVRRHFQGRGWECAPALEAMDAAPDFYFDRVSQIRMEQWARGRVALVGDAAFCVSLLAGQGSALSMVGAYVLAGELEKAGGDHARAFAGYQERLASFIGAKQRAAERFAGFFVPRSRLALILRNLMSKLLSVSVVARLAMVRELTETFRLPEYAASAAPR